MTHKVDAVFIQILDKCNPRFSKTFQEVFDAFFSGLSEKEHNFLGGNNDKRRTLHENIFALLYPALKSQVHFGTGKGGYEKYGVKRFTADFYDEENHVIYEIDGTNHKNELQRLKDKIRDYFFYHELGIRTTRFTNKEVERLLHDRLTELERAGVLK